jgi:hypothetical protein
MDQNKEELWIYNPHILFTKITDIYPSSNTNFFNAIARYWMVCGAIFMLFARYKWAYLCVVGFFLTTLVGWVYTKSDATDEKISFIKKHLSCRRSTINNPMGNILPLDLEPNLEACDDEPEEKINNNLYWEFYEDQNDLTAKTRLRSFITMPITTIVNKRKNFLEFMYQPTLKCKSDGVGCEDYRDIRYSKKSNLIKLSNEKIIYNSIV